MGVSIGEAWSIEATRRAFSYKGGPLPYSPPDWLRWSQSDWDSCSPGQKRELLRGRDWYTGEKIVLAPPLPEPTLAEKREAARIAAKERL